MSARETSTRALLLAISLVGCGGATKGGSNAVPGDAGAETSVPQGDGGVHDAAPRTDAADAQPTPVGPGLLLFAGYGEGPLDDTWSWDGSSWTELPAGGPAVRDDQSMIGTGAGTVLLFGGDGLGSTLGDTWVWTASAGWTQESVTGPSPRAGAATAVLGGKVYLYGGQGAGGFLSDTWEWDGTKWTQLTVTGPTPGGRYGHSMATLGNVIVLFGNVGGPTDTWLFDGTSWTQSKAPGPTADPGGLSDSRGFQTMATLGDKVYLFGGEQDANHILDDTWAWDGTSWTQLTVASPPPARFHAAMATYQSKIVLFGGAGAIPNGAPFLADTWTWDGTTWTQVQTASSPSARYGYVLAAH